MSELIHDDVVESATFSPDGRRVSTAGEVMARLWDVVTGHEVGSLNVNGDDVVEASFSPDSRRAITISERSEVAPDGTRARTAGGPARLWDATSGEHLAELSNAGPVKSASFSHDGSRVVTGGGSVRIWDAASGAQVGEIRNDEPMDFASFSPDGQRLVTRAEFFLTTARIWDVQTGKPLGELTHDAGISMARFSPDGRRVITYAGGVRLWDASWPARARNAGLVGEVCWRKLSGEARRLTEADVRASRVLAAQRIGEDVCEGIPPAGAP